MLDFTTAEAAEMLDTTPDRGEGPAPARPHCAREPAPPAADEPELAARFADAFANDDIEALPRAAHRRRLAGDAARAARLPGHAAIAAFLRASAAYRTWRYALTPTRVNGQPAFDLGRDGLVVLDTREDGITAIIRFLPTR